MTKDELAITMRDLVELGYIEDTGDKRPDSEGRLQPVYRMSALGQVADHYLRQGFTFETAMAKAKASH